MAHAYTVEILWERGDQIFIDSRYSRKHVLMFDGGIQVAGSSSPLIVPEPYSDSHAIDPEEAFVSAISSCHMLWFLSIAAIAGYVVDRYLDNATGFMTKNERKKFWVSTVRLQPEVIFSGEQLPSTDEILRMHNEAHEECFIANSVKTDIQVRPL